MKLVNLFGFIKKGVGNDVSDNRFSISNITRRTTSHHEVTSLLSVHGEFISTDSGVFV